MYITVRSQVDWERRAVNSEQEPCLDGLKQESAVVRAAKKCFKLPHALLCVKSETERLCKSADLIKICLKCGSGPK